MKTVLVVCMVLFFFSSVSAFEKNIIDLHNNADKLSNKECLACHSRILKEVSLNKKYKMFHRVHLESKLGTPKKCADCHQYVDLRNASASALRKQVDPEVCAGCHSGGVKGALVLFEK